MKTSLFLLLLLLFPGISGCDLPADKPVSVEKLVTDTMVIVKDFIINSDHFDSIPSGYYQRMLPCKNYEDI